MQGSTAERPQLAGSGAADSPMLIDWDGGGVEVIELEGEEGGVAAPGPTGPGTGTGAAAHEPSAGAGLATVGKQGSEAWGTAEATGRPQAATDAVGGVGWEEISAAQNAPGAGGLSLGTGESDAVLQGVEEKGGGGAWQALPGAVKRRRRAVAVAVLSTALARLDQTMGRMPSSRPAKLVPRPTKRARGVITLTADALVRAQRRTRPRLTITPPAGAPALPTAATSKANGAVGAGAKKPAAAARSGAGSAPSGGFRSIVGPRLGLAHAYLRGLAHDALPDDYWENDFGAGAGMGRGGMVGQAARVHAGHPGKGDGLQPPAYNSNETNGRVPPGTVGSAWNGQQGSVGIGLALGGGGAGLQASFAGAGMGVGSGAGINLAGPAPGGGGMGLQALSAGVGTAPGAGFQAYNAGGGAGTAAILQAYNASAAAALPAASTGAAAALQTLGTGAGAGAGQDADDDDEDLDMIAALNEAFEEEETVGTVGPLPGTVGPAPVAGGLQLGGEVPAGAAQGGGDRGAGGAGEEEQAGMGEEGEEEGGDMFLPPPSPNEWEEI